MFCKKCHSWFWYAFWSLVAAACIYLIARFFLNAAAKQGKINPSKPSKDKSGDKDTWFI
ncbi:MAG: hypothetical protein PHC61_07125 [Chitinivibrionales bacterium]|nr:hypothetical protein [Chitinivibrionales bacterium]